MNKVYFFLILTILILSSYTVVNVSATTNTSTNTSTNTTNINESFTYIEDTYQYFTFEEKVAIEEKIKQLPETYKVVVLPTVYGSVESAAESLFEYRDLSQDTILIILLTNDKSIYAFTGDALQQKGLDSLFFEQEIEKYFVPSVKSKSVSQALIDLIDGISVDIPKYLVKDKNSPKLPDPPDTALSAQEDVPWYKTNLVYGLIVLLLILLFGYIFSRDLHKKRSQQNKNK